MHGDIIGFYGGQNLINASTIGARDRVAEQVDSTAYQCSCWSGFFLTVFFVVLSPSSAHPVISGNSAWKGVYGSGDAFNITGRKIGYLLKVRDAVFIQHFFQHRADATYFFLNHLFAQSLCQFRFSPRLVCDFW